MSKETGHKDGPLAAEFVLGLLPEAEAAQVEARLPFEADLRDDVGFWSDSFASLTEEIDPVNPPAALKARVENVLFGDVETASLTQSGGFWHFLSGLAVAAAVGLVVMLTQLTQAPESEADRLVAHLTGEVSDVMYMALYDPAEGRIDIHRTGGAAGEGRDLEMWVIAGDNPPVSLGVLPRDIRGVLELSPAQTAMLAQGAVLAVSDEPVGGSPTGAPTGDVLAVGPVNEI